MKFIKQNKSNLKKMQRLTGLRSNEFDILVKRIDVLWEQAEKKRLNEREDRKRKIGGGRRYRLATMSAKVAAVLIYYRLYVTQEVLSIMFDIDQSTASRLLKKLLPLIEQAADPKLKTFLSDVQKQVIKQRSGWEEVVKKYPELIETATDATEQLCYRSKDYTIQEQFYSGKTKQHAIKYQITRAFHSGLILDVSDSYHGKMHDKAIIDHEKTVEKLPKETIKRFDSGYQGLQKQYPDQNVIVPIKKPKGGTLSDEAKAYNRQNSKRRVGVEHSFARIKSFKICDLRFRQAFENHNQTVRNVAALVNLTLELRTSLTVK